MVDSSYLNVHGNFFFFMFVCNLYYTFFSELQGNPSLVILPSSCTPPCYSPQSYTRFWKYCSVLNVLWNQFHRVDAIMKP